MWACVNRFSVDIIYVFLKNVSPESVAFSQDTANPLRPSKTEIRLPWRYCLASGPE